MAARPNRAVFLDRDGVLTIPEFRNGRSYAAQSLETFQFYSDAADAVTHLKGAGFTIVVVTNQPDIGAGLVPQDLIDTMHERLRRAMPVDDVEVAVETRDQAQGLLTDRRKPGIGMLMSAAKRWNIDLNSSYMVGDRASDVEAGLAAGCTSVFIDLGYTSELVATGQAATVSSAGEAAAWIVADASK